MAYTTLNKMVTVFINNIFINRFHSRLLMSDKWENSSIRNEKTPESVIEKLDVQGEQCVRSNPHDQMCIQ